MAVFKGWMDCLKHTCLLPEPHFPFHQMYKDSMVFEHLAHQVNGGLWLQTDADSIQAKAAVTARQPVATARQPVTMQFARLKLSPVLAEECAQNAPQGLWPDLQLLTNPHHQLVSGGSNTLAGPAHAARSCLTRLPPAMRLSSRHAQRAGPSCSSPPSGRNPNPCPGLGRLD